MPGTETTRTVLTVGDDLIEIPHEIDVVEHRCSVVTKEDRQRFCYEGDAGDIILFDALYASFPARIASRTYGETDSGLIELSLKDEFFMAVYPSDTGCCGQRFKHIWDRRYGDLEDLFRRGIRNESLSGSREANLTEEQREKFGQYEKFFMKFFNNKRKIEARELGEDGGLNLSYPAAINFDFIGHLKRQQGVPGISENRFRRCSL